MFQHILVPTDFSPFSRRALDYAVALARGLRADIEVLHIFPVAAPVAGDITYAATIVRLDETMRQTLFQDLQRFMAPAALAAVPTTAFLGEGDPSSAILERAQKRPIDLIVMGTHGLRGFDRWFIGSVAQRVMRQAACPVLTVPLRKDESLNREPPVLGQILCPVDLSKHSVATLELAVAVARASNAGLTVLHVMEGAPHRDEPPSGSLPFWDELRRHVEALSRGISEKLEPGEIADVHGIERLVIQGRAYEEILKTALERRVDLIVMGVHGRKGIGLPFFGSTTQHVVQHAECPVLTVRPR